MHAGRTSGRQLTPARRSQAGRLIATWSLAALVSLFGVATGYTLFVGRTHVVSNETIYEGHYKVGQPDTVEFYTLKGRGWTSYGENGLVVNKTLNPTATRVLFLGDSFTQARHVSDSEKFTEIVEQRWNSTHRRTGSILSAATTLLFVILSWVLFRAPDMPVALAVYRKLLWIGSTGAAWANHAALAALGLIVPILFVDRRYTSQNRVPFKTAFSFSAALIVTLTLLIIYLFAPTSAGPFIYVQF